MSKTKRKLVLLRLLKHLIKASQLNYFNLHWADILAVKSIECTSVPWKKTSNFQWPAIVTLVVVKIDLLMMILQAVGFYMSFIYEMLWFMNHFYSFPELLPEKSQRSETRDPLLLTLGESLRKLFYFNILSYNAQSYRLLTSQCKFGWYRRKGGAITPSLLCWQNNRTGHP